MVVFIFWSIDNELVINVEFSEGKVFDYEYVVGYVWIEGVYFRYFIRLGVRVLRNLIIDVFVGI